MHNTTQLLDKLEKLRSLDTKREVFGASSHEYRLNPCLKESAVNSFEKKYKIRLPTDYRRFLLEVGNGGAGPYHGLFKLGEHDDGWGFRPWKGGFLVGDPSAIFVYHDSWNLPDTFWADSPHNKEWVSEEESDKAYESWDAQLVEIYWSPSVMNGAIPICHCGCALRQWLVITGPERGNVWQDDRADLNGIFPLENQQGNRVSFTDWYVTWLEESIRSLEE